MHRNLNAHIIFLVVLLSVIVSSQTKENILVRVGHKDITVSEYKARSEFTIRPDNFKDKDITLNNLIIEKILALEAEKDGIILDQATEAHLKGIKEQNMREKLYDMVAYDKVKLNFERIKKSYKLSRREYEVEFYQMNRRYAKQLKSAIEKRGINTDSIFQYLSNTLGKQPVHKVKYTDPDDIAIHEALYSKLLSVGDIVGPIELTNGNYIIMRILNWTDYPLISETEQRERWEEVEKKERRIEAGKKWQSYVLRLMKNKKIEFNKETFKKLADVLKSKYLQNNQDTTVTFGELNRELRLTGMDLKMPFFTFENKIWTIGDFRNELMSRPLVFRTTNMDSSNFAEQFRMAIADVMRDHCLTREAYKKSLDKLESVKRTVSLWRDSFLANEQQKRIMKKAIENGEVNADNDLDRFRYWESYLQNLREKYSGMVYINHLVFDSIQLTKVDMVALKYGMPYPNVVPGFPLLLSTTSIDFVRDNN